MQETQKKSAGFWSRLTAGLIDLIGIIALVSAVAYATATYGHYIPIETTVIAVYIIYKTVGLKWKGQTIGGLFCGQKVMALDGRGLSLIQALLHRKTGVFLQSSSRTRRCRAIALVWIILVGWTGIQVVKAAQLYCIHHSWCIDANITAENRKAHIGSAIDVSSLDDTRKHEMAMWLSDHAQDPLEYVVKVAAQHQVTILGEVHGQKQYLMFLNRIIPDLYHKSGVRCIALECCLSNQDDKLVQLVNSEHFDQELAKDIARNAVWQAWGWKGYWDVLETVWRLNRSLEPRQERLRIVGLSPAFDLPSFALVMKGPWIEKLRLLRLLRIDRIISVFCHDAFYARCVERQAFVKGRRTVVWVGAAHALLRCSRQVVKNGHIINRSHRMGSMLYGRYGDQIAQIILHQSYSHGKVARLIEECGHYNIQSGFAFSVPDSPFASLRDGYSLFYYSRQPDLRFVDLVSAYVMLVPEDKLESCDWIRGFISRFMFGRNKPFYEMLCEQKLIDYHQADQNMTKGVQRL
jgi:uncharacterized RDD family membrane protein YckC